ncbi:MAG: hypothetical protein GY698_23245, partial [Actinomycetia bacterium]|nr:hypothetical protein [Actinomycetes bacterium]
MGSITGASTPVGIALLCAVGGLAVGFWQGRETVVRLIDGELFAKRTLIGVVLWSGGLAGMQLAGLGNRSGLFSVGQAIGIFSMSTTVGLVVGRKDREQAARLQPVAAALVLVVGVLGASIAGLAQPGDAQDFDLDELTCESYNAQLEADCVATIFSEICAGIPLAPSYVPSYVAAAQAAVDNSGCGGDEPEPEPEPEPPEPEPEPPNPEPDNEDGDITTDEGAGASAVGGFGAAGMGALTAAEAAAGRRRRRQGPPPGPGTPRPPPGGPPLGGPGGGGQPPAGATQSPPGFEDWSAPRSDPGAGVPTSGSSQQPQGGSTPGPSFGDWGSTSGATAESEGTETGAVSGAGPNHGAEPSWAQPGGASGSDAGGATSGGGAGGETDPGGIPASDWIGGASGNSGTSPTDFVTPDAGTPGGDSGTGTGQTGLDHGPTAGFPTEPPTDFVTPDADTSGPDGDGAGSSAEPGADSDDVNTPAAQESSPPDPEQQPAEGSAADTESAEQSDDRSGGGPGERGGRDGSTDGEYGEEPTMTSLSDLLGEGDVAGDDGGGGAEPYVPESIDEPDPDAAPPDSPDPSQDDGPRSGEGDVDASAPAEPEDDSTPSTTEQPRSEPGDGESSAEAQETPGEQAPPDEQVPPDEHDFGDDIMDGLGGAQLPEGAPVSEQGGGMGVPRSRAHDLNKDGIYDHVEYDMDGDGDFETKGRITTDAQGNNVVVGADGEPLFGDETTETASTQSPTQSDQQAGSGGADPLEMQDGRFLDTNRDGVYDRWEQDADGDGIAERSGRLERRDGEVYLR